jgi:hypothetical protein
MRIDITGFQTSDHFPRLHPAIERVHKSKGLCIIMLRAFHDDFLDQNMPHISLIDATVLGVMFPGCADFKSLCGLNRSF